jgi:molecular chaperone DnaK
VSVVIGIDLGTTNSLAAICDERGPRVLRDERGNALIPSVVRFEADGSVIVGERAKREAPEHPLATVSSVKRLMGRSVRDAAADLPFLGYEVVPGERETARVRIPLPDGRELLLSPEEVSARILAEVKRVAEHALGQPVSRAVITVPAYFDDAQRQATRTAARLAGLEAVRIVPEPTAAALAYGLGVRETRERTVCVFDMGGGTFDVSVLRLTPRAAEGERDFYEVLAIAGDTRLGGDDADHALVALFAREVVGETSSPAARRALLAEAERVKIALSGAEQATARIPTAARVEGGAREELRTQSA